MRRIALVPMTVLIVAFALVACGDSAPTKADYKKQFDPINQQVKDLGSAVGDAVLTAKGKTDTELATQFTDLSAQTETLAGDVGKLETPGDDIQKNQDALVSALREGARGLQSIAEAASAGNATAAKGGTIKLATVTSPKIKESREAIEKQLAGS